MNESDKPVPPDDPRSGDNQTAPGLGSGSQMLLAKSTNPKLEVAAIGALVGVLFVAGLAASAFTPMQGVVYAPGQVETAQSRQAVQHPEGGVIARLHARDGALVNQGAPLVELSSKELSNRLGSASVELLRTRLEVAKLRAELSGAQKLDMSTDDIDMSLPGLSSLLREMQDDARREIAERASLEASQDRILDERRSQGEREIGANRRAAAALNAQLIALQEQRKRIQNLLAEGFATATQALSVDRQIGELEARIAELDASVARAEGGVAEQDLQKEALKEQRRREVLERLVEANARMRAAEFVMRVASNEREKAIVRAPTAGRIVNATVFTEGGVAAPGQVLMEIVPAKAALRVAGTVAPEHADEVRVGKQVRIEFPGLAPGKPNDVVGTVADLSADALIDSRTGKAFYRIVAELDDAQAARMASLLGGDDVTRPGTPVVIIVPVRDRSVLAYLTEPFTRAFERAFSEP